MGSLDYQGNEWSWESRRCQKSKFETIKLRADILFHPHCPHSHSPRLSLCPSCPHCLTVLSSSCHHLLVLSLSPRLLIILIVLSSLSSLALSPRPCNSCCLHLFKPLIIIVNLSSSSHGLHPSLELGYVCSQCPYSLSATIKLLLCNLSNPIPHLTPNSHPCPSPPHQRHQRIV